MIALIHIYANSFGPVFVYIARVIHTFLFNFINQLSESPLPVVEFKIIGIDNPFVEIVFDAKGYGCNTFVYHVYREDAREK